MGGGPPPFGGRRAPRLLPGVRWPDRPGGSRRDLTCGAARLGAVVIGLGLGDVLPVRQRPVGKGFQQMRQACPHLGEPVIDLGGNRGVDRAVHQPVALQASHRQGEHALRDAADGALQLTETQWTVRQLHADQQGPLVSQSVMKRPDAGILAVCSGLELCDRDVKKVPADQVGRDLIWMRSYFRSLFHRGFHYAPDDDAYPYSERYLQHRLCRTD